MERVTHEPIAISVSKFDHAFSTVRAPTSPPRTFAISLFTEKAEAVAIRVAAMASFMVIRLSSY